jgi:hypothetical protein
MQLTYLHILHFIKIQLGKNCIGSRNIHNKQNYTIIW